jgi:aryl-alcohol dehydrogenase-like predicted oxidoreductase
MEYTTLGETGLSVSRLCLGTLSLGSSDYHDWVLDPDESRAIVEGAIDLGINFFDTANVYSDGESERVLGSVLAEHDRDRLVVASKVHPARGPDSYPPAGGGGGLSRKAIEQSLAHSLDRLGLDTIDLYQIHRWDDDTPIYETLGALSDAVRRNQVRYLGASSMWAHQFGHALSTADRLGLERFVTMQNHYNLVYREEEREMLPLCAREGVGVIPWGTLAQGYLTRPHDSFSETLRGESIERTPFLQERNAAYRAGGGEEINGRVASLAEEKGASMAQIALAWVLGHEAVDGAIVGATSVDHLEDAVGALDVDLSEAERNYLEAPYRPVEVLGHE